MFFTSPQKIINPSITHKWGQRALRGWVKGLEDLGGLMGGSCGLGALGGQGVHRRLDWQNEGFC